MTSQYILFQYPADFDVSRLHNLQIDLETEELQPTAVGQLLVSPPTSNEQIFPLKEHSNGKLKIAGSFAKCVQVLPVRQ